MAKTQPTVLETGTFASPATQTDSPYQLLQKPDGSLVVVCVESRTHHAVSVLSAWSYADIESQRRAFIREIVAWFCTNGPKDEAREAAAVNEVKRVLASEYDTDDLKADQEWNATNDLSVRVPILRKTLPEPARLDLIELASRVATVGDGVSPTDAQFIEILGSGLGLDAEAVTNIVIAAMQSQAQAAA